MLTAREWPRRARSSGRWQLETRGAQPDAGRPGGWTVWLKGRTPKAASGRERQGSQSLQGATELVFPGPVLGQMQGEATGLAGDASGEGEEPFYAGSSGGVTTSSPSCRCAPSSRASCWAHGLHRQPGGVGPGDASRGTIDLDSTICRDLQDWARRAPVDHRLHRPAVGLQSPECWPSPVGDAPATIAVVGAAAPGSGQHRSGRGFTSCVR